MPKISVLMPIYNVERYLREALLSVADQTLRDIEILCINDGSTDDSRAIAAEFCKLDARFRLIDKPNSGYGASMNRGLAEAQGDYIAILEPDDIYEPTALETLYKAAQISDADVAKANYWFYWSKPQLKDKLIQVVKPAWFEDAARIEHLAVGSSSSCESSDRKTSGGEASGHEASGDADASSNPGTPDGIACMVADPYELPGIFFMIPSIWSALYKRSYLAEHNIRFLETPGASFQDLSFTFKVFAYTHKVCLVDVPVLHYRQDNESSSVNDPKKAYCVIEELAEIDAVVEALEKSESGSAHVLEDYSGKIDASGLKDAESKNINAGGYLSQIAYRIAYDNYLWNYQRLAPDVRKTFIQQGADDLRAKQADGYYNPEFFEPYQQLNHDALMKDVDAFDKAYPKTPSLPAKAWYYFKLGGPSALASILRR